MLLPRINPLYENIPISSFSPPELLKKMGSGGFTGYVGYGSAQTEGYLVLLNGALISILLLEGERRKSGFEAVTALFQQMAAGDGLVNVYRLSTELLQCTQALLHGPRLLQPTRVADLDLKALFNRLKSQGFQGTVSFSTPERNALIFYQGGIPIGFYHDAAHGLETTPAETQRIAGLPGAVVEACTAAPPEELLHQNLLESLNLDKLWQAAINRAGAGAPKAPPKPVPTPAAPEEASMPEQLPAAAPADLEPLAEDLREIVMAYLGRPGAALLDSLFEEHGGIGCLQSPARTDQLQRSLAEHAAELDPEARINEMIEVMQAEITSRCRD